MSSIGARRAIGPRVDVAGPRRGGRGRATPVELADSRSGASGPGRGRPAGARLGPALDEGGSADGSGPTRSAARRLARDGAGFGNESWIDGRPRAGPDGAAGPDRSMRLEETIVDGSRPGPGVGRPAGRGAGPSSRVCGGDGGDRPPDVGSSSRPGWEGMMGIAQKVAREFSDAVRSRGQSYFAKGRVAITASSAGEVVAKVRGTEKYKVRLRLRGIKLIATCTCPYFGPAGDAVQAPLGDGPGRRRPGPAPLGADPPAPAGHRLSRPGRRSRPADGGPEGCRRPAGPCPTRCRTSPGTGPVPRPATAAGPARGTAGRPARPPGSYRTSHGPGQGQGPGEGPGPGYGPPGARARATRPQRARAGPGPGAAGPAAPGPEGRRRPGPGRTAGPARIPRTGGPGGWPATGSTATSTRQHGRRPSAAGQAARPPRRRPQKAKRLLAYILDVPATLAANQVVIDLARRARRPNGDWGPLKPWWHTPNLPGASATTPRTATSWPTWSRRRPPSASALGGQRQRPRRVGRHPPVRPPARGPGGGRRAAGPDRPAPAPPDRRRGRPARRRWDDQPPWRFGLDVRSDPAGKRWTWRGMLRRRVTAEDRPDGPGRAAGPPARPGRPGGRQGRPVRRRRPVPLGDADPPREGDGLLRLGRAGRDAREDPGRLAGRPVRADRVRRSSSARSTTSPSPA